MTGKKLHSNQQWPPKNSDATNLTCHFKGGHTLWEAV